MIHKKQFGHFFGGASYLFHPPKVSLLRSLTPELNARQEKVIRRIFEAGPDGFDGDRSARKYMSIGKTSKATAATAARDLAGLVAMGALLAIGGPHGTWYVLEN